MRYPLAGGGKRIRPRLCLAAARAGGADPATALPAAAAIELIHTFSLVHDDLPALDDDDERRGRPSLHVAHGEAVAILAGDGLLNAAYRIAAEQLDAPPKVRLAGGRRAGGGRRRHDRRPVPRRGGPRARRRGARPAAPSQDGLADLGRRRRADCTSPGSTTTPSGRTGRSLRSWGSCSRSSTTSSTPPPTSGDTCAATGSTAPAAWPRRPGPGRSSSSPPARARRTSSRGSWPRWRTGRRERRDRRRGGGARRRARAAVDRASPPSPPRRRPAGRRRRRRVVGAAAVVVPRHAERRRGSGADRRAGRPPGRLRVPAHARRPGRHLAGRRPLGRGRVALGPARGARRGRRDGASRRRRRASSQRAACATSRWRSWPGTPTRCGSTSAAACARPSSSSFASAASRMATKRRLDVLLVERGLVETRSRAQALIMAGRVHVDGAPVTKAGTPTAGDAAVELIAPPRYVSRGGEKLETALARVRGRRRRRAVPRRRRLDGRVHRLPPPARRGRRGRARRRAETSSTSASRRPAGDGDRRDERPRRSTARRCRSGPTLVTADVSFISLRLVLPAVLACAEPPWRALVLVKPQFEAGRGPTSAGASCATRRCAGRVLQEFCAFRHRQRLGRPRRVRFLCAGARPGIASTSCTLASPAHPCQEDQTADVADQIERTPSPPVTGVAVARAAVLTHGRPEVIGDAPERLRARRRPLRRRDRRRATTPTSSSCWAATARCCGRSSAGSAPASPASASTSAGSGSSPASPASDLEQGLERAFAGGYEVLDLPTLVGDAGGDARDRRQRHRADERRCWAGWRSSSGASTASRWASWAATA